MARKVLTVTSIDRTRPPPVGRRMDWDAVVPSLALRTTANGAKSWILMTRLRGKLIFHTIGRYPSISLIAARTLAREDLEMVARGEDPRARKKEPTAEEGAFPSVVAEFLERSAKQTRTFDETERIVNKELLPKWRSARIGELGRREVVAVLDAIVDRGAPVMANRVLGVISRIFSFALNRGLIEAHPCFRLKKPGREGKREKVLSEEEIRKLWKAWDQMAFPFGYLFQILLVTAQRRGEAAETAWADIDLDESVWRMVRTKAGHFEVTPVSWTPDFRE